MGRYFSSQRQKAPRGAFDRTFRNLTVRGTETVTGTLTANGTLAATSNVTLGTNSGNTVAVQGSTTFSAAVAVNSNLNVSGNVVFSSTGAMVLPSGNSSARPGSPSVGMLRYNTQVSNLEFWNSTQWTLVGTGANAGGATGGGTDRVFYENDQTVNTAYSITAGKNAVSAGPITINAAVTIPPGSSWAIV